MKVIIEQDGLTVRPLILGFIPSPKTFKIEDNFEPTNLIKCKKANKDLCRCRTMSKALHVRCSNIALKYAPGSVHYAQRTESGKISIMPQHLKLKEDIRAGEVLFRKGEIRTRPEWEALFPAWFQMNFEGTYLKTV